MHKRIQFKSTLSLDTEQSVKVSWCIFTNIVGGGIICSVPHFTIDSSLLQNCSKPNGQGGGIEFVQLDGSDYVMNCTTFLYNSAKSYGQAFAAYDSSNRSASFIVNITGCTVCGSKGGSHPYVLIGGRYEINMLNSTQHYDQNEGCAFRMGGHYGRSEAKFCISTDSNCPTMAVYTGSGDVSTGLNYIVSSLFARVDCPSKTIFCWTGNTTFEKCDFIMPVIQISGATAQRRSLIVTQMCSRQWPTKLRCYPQSILSLHMGLLTCVTFLPLTHYQNCDSFLHCRL